jgi:disease resistance protein RPM1
MEASGAIKTLLPKLNSLLKNKYKLPSGVRRQITSLKHEMSCMSAFLVKHEKVWHNQVRELSLDIQDCVDIFTSELDSGEEAAARRGLRRRFKKLKAHYKIGHRIEQLKAGQLVESSNCHSRCENRLHGYPQGSRGIDLKEEVVDLLLSEDAAGTQLLKVVAIAGSAGMGKTALSTQVYEEIKGQFDCAAFVSLPRNANVTKVLSDIFLEISGSMCFEDQIIDQIKKHLQDKRYICSTKYSSNNKSSRN